MGLGLTSYIPILFYCIGILSALGSIFYSPICGMLFLFPLLPYASVLKKLNAFPLGKEHLNLLILFILIGVYFRKSQIRTNKDPEKIDLNLPILLLSISSLVGLFNGLAVQGGVDFAYIIDWKDYMLLPLIWFLVVQVIRDRKTLGIFTLVMILGVLGVDYYFYTNLKWMNLSHFSYKTRDSFSGLFIYLGANHYGAFFVQFLFIQLGIFLFSRKFWQKVGLGVLMALTGYCLMYTFSRGAYAAFLAGILFVGLVKDRKLLILLILFLVFWKSIVPVSVVERVEMTRTEDGQLEESAADRVMLWQHAWEMFQESPVYGQGFNVFSFAGYHDTHNYYLKMLAEQGVIGLCTFLFLLITALRTGWALYREARDDLFKGLGLGFSGCVIAVMVTNFFGNRWSYLSLGSYFWIFMGIATRALLISRQEARAAVQETQSALKPDVSASVLKPAGGTP